MYATWVSTICNKTNTTAPLAYQYPKSPQKTKLALACTRRFRARLGTRHRARGSDDTRHRHRHRARLRGSDGTSHRGSDGSNGSNTDGDSVGGSSLLLGQRSSRRLSSSLETLSLLGRHDEQSGVIQEMTKKCEEMARRRRKGKRKRKQMWSIQIDVQLSHRPTWSSGDVAMHR